MKIKITHNLGLKIISVIVAFLIWLIVVNVSNPSMDETISIPLEVRNGDVLTNAGLAYEIEGNRTSVTVTCTARIQDQSNISRADFQAYIDLADYYPATGTVPVYVEVLNNKESLIQSVSVRPSVLRVHTEEIQTKDFDLIANTVGGEAAGYNVDSIELTPSMVTVKAPESVMGRISSVGVEINTEGISSDISGTAAPVFYDANGYSMNLVEEANVDVEEIDYYVHVVESKTMTLDFQVGGQPAEGYRYTGLEASAEAVNVTGPHDIVAAVDTITIPADVLSVEGATSDRTYTVDVEDYLPDPENMSIPWDSQVTITLRVQRLERRTLEISTNRIIQEGGQDNYHYTFDQASIDVTVEGLPEELEGLEASDLIMEMDVSQMGIGSYAGELTFDGLPDGVQVVDYSDFHVLISSREIGPGVSSAPATSEAGGETTSAAETVEAAAQESSIEQTESGSETAAQ